MAGDNPDATPEDDAAQVGGEDGLAELELGALLADGDGDDDAGEAEDWPPEVDVKAVGEELAAAEAFVEERVQRSLARYRGMFPPEVIERYADDLRCFLLTHPVASKMLARIRPRAARVMSGEGAVPHAAATDEAPDANKGKMG
jgi:hypothetical protein